MFEGDPDLFSDLCGGQSVDGGCGGSQPHSSHRNRASGGEGVPEEVIAFIDDADANNSDIDEDLLDDAESEAFAGVGTFKRLIKEHQNIQYEVFSSQ